MDKGFCIGCGRCVD
ncbi:hypothetical protein ACFOER_02190 [Sphingobacterium zeae]